MRRAVTPIVLITLATCAAAYAYLVDRGKVSDAQRAARRRDVFPSFRVEDVRRIELDHGAEKLVLERETDAGDGWDMISPQVERADPSAVDALLRELELATWIRRVSDGDTLGLIDPRATGEIDLGTIRYRVALGADAPRPDGASYFKLDGEGTFVVGRSLTVQLLRTADAYRNRALFPFGGNEVSRVEATGGAGPAFVLERHGATFVGKGGLRAPRSLVERVLLAFADTRADVFLRDAEAEAAMGSPVLTLRVRAKDSGLAPVELHVGGACPGRADDVVVVRTSFPRMAACATKEALPAMPQDAARLVDEALLFARADEIEEVRIEAVGAGGPRIEIARRGASWHERSPDDRDLGAYETDSANALAQAIATAHGSDAHRPASGESFLPMARVSVVRAGSGTREVIEVSRPGADGAVVARRADDGALLRLPRDVARHFFPHPAALRARPIWRAAFDPASAIAIDDTCGPAPQHLELHDHSWTMLAPTGFPVDPVSAADLTSAVARAKADAWIAEGDDGGFGFGQAGGCQVGLTLSSPTGGDPRRVAIVFGEAGEGGVYAHTLDDAAVFVAPKILYDLVQHPAIDRSAFRIEPAGLSVAVLERGTDRVTLTRDGSLLVRADATAAEDAGAPGALSRALSSLYAIAALHPGPPHKEEGMGGPTLVVELTRAGAHKPSRIVFGAEAQVDGVDAYYARVGGVDATFAVPKGVVGALLAGW